MNDILEAECITWTMKMYIIVVLLTKRQNHVFRHSMTLSLFCSITQANETGGSQQTELEGAKRCFAYLQQLGLSIAIFVSDRHRGIAKWIRETSVDTIHYFNIWHVARSV